MNFAENLRRIRKERGLSQEALAEIMDVSRQAVSKWEQGEGYPEVEKLLLLASTLHISLDALMASEPEKESIQNSNRFTGSILIRSPHENTVMSCCHVNSTQMMKGGKRSPKLALFGVGIAGASIWGPPTTFLGWYASEELLTKEIEEIHQALLRGEPSYELKYSVKVARKWLRMEMVAE